MRFETDEELLSAVLEGEASPEEVQRVRRDPALSRRLDALQTARDLVAEPVDPLSPTEADRIISTAMTTAEPAELTERRDRWLHKIPIGWVAAAAVVAVVAIAAAVVFGGSEDQAPVAGPETDTPSRAEDRIEDRSAELDSQAEDPLSDLDVPADAGQPESSDAAGPDTMTETAPLSASPASGLSPWSGLHPPSSEPIDLGYLAEVEVSDELTRPVIERFESTTARGHDRVAGQCLESHREASVLPPLVGVGTATVGGTEVAVGAVGHAPPEHFSAERDDTRLLVASLDDCTLLLTGPFEMLLR